ncbi:MAG: DUF1816 domain-containing protein [Heteroscytonema crispum UTEX LB 1556]
MKTILDNLKEALINTFDNLGLAWWVEIVTQNPRCTYYFGPFLSSTDAKVAIKGYVEDLEMEGAQGIAVNVKRCKPNSLTISEDLGERIDRKVKPIFSGQM